MKYKDKFGNEIECTPQEYMELCAMQQQQTLPQQYEPPQQSPPQVQQQPQQRPPLFGIRGKNHDWKKIVSEVKEIINGSNTPLSSTRIVKCMRERGGTYIGLGSSRSKLMSFLKQCYGIKKIQVGKRMYFFRKDYEPLEMPKMAPRAPHGSKASRRINEELQTIKEFLETQLQPLYLQKIIDMTGIRHSKNLRNALMESPDIQTIKMGKGDGNRIFYKFANLDYMPKKKNLYKSERMTFVARRASYLMNNKGESRSDANKIAGQDYLRVGKTFKTWFKGKVSDYKIAGKPKPQPVDDIPGEFPSLYQLDPLTLNRVKDKISECISEGISGEGKIGYFDLKEICRWENAHHWLHFINHFMAKKGEIAKFFCVDDKFCHKKIKRHDYITYGGSE